MDKSMYSPSDRIIWFLTVALFSSFYIAYSNIYGSYVLFGISIAILIVELLNGERLIIFSRYHVWILLFALFSLLSSLWAWDSSLATEKGITLVELLVCYTCLFPYYDRQSTTDRLISAIMWGCNIIICYSFFKFGFRELLMLIREGERLASAFVNTNSLGMLSSITIIINVYRALNDRKIFWWNIFILPALLLIIASQSRKAIFMLVVGVIMIYSNMVGAKSSSSKRLFKMLFAAVFAFAILYGISKLSFMSGAMERFGGFIAYFTGIGEADHSTIIRQQMIEGGFEQFLKTPILGIGMGNARLLNSMITGRSGYLHNNFIELLVNGGIIGFILYYSMHIYLIKQYFRKRTQRDPRDLLCITLLLVLIVTDYGMVSYYAKANYMYYLLLFTQLSKNNFMKLSLGQ